MTLPIILIHGYPLDGGMWDGVRAALPTDIPVQAPDLPGFHGRLVPPGEPTLEAYADDIARLSFDRAVIVGMSMGGYVALSFLEHHRARVAGIGLISTHPFADTIAQREGRHASATKIRAEGPNVAAEAMIGKLFANSDSDDAGKALRARVRASASAAGADGLAWSLEAMARRPDRSALLSALEIPIAVIHGALDAVIPISTAHAYSGTIPGVVFTEAPGSGHHTPAEAPQLVADALTALWRRCG